MKLDFEFSSLSLSTYLYVDCCKKDVPVIFDEVCFGYRLILNVQTSYYFGWLTSSVLEYSVSSLCVGVKGERLKTLLQNRVWRNICLLIIASNCRMQ